MAARSLATLTISFGLVSIPVKLFAATQSSQGVSFNLLHRDCGSRLRQQYVCIKEDVLVERADMVKGFEFAKDQYVAFSSDELKALEEEGTHTVEITEFVPAETIDPVFYDRAYYLAPDKGGAKPYTLLAEGMRRTGRCALARWATRGKQYVVQVRPTEGGLVLQQLLYAPEVRSIGELEIAPAAVREAELGLAVQLIEQISAERFDPAAYEDEVKKRIEAAVERKIKGKEIAVSPEAPGDSGKVIDLMQALRASLNKSDKPTKPAVPKAPESEAPAKRKPQKGVTLVAVPARRAAAGKK